LYKDFKGFGDAKKAQDGVNKDWIPSSQGLTGVGVARLRAPSPVALTL